MGERLDKHSKSKIQYIKDHADELFSDLSQEIRDKIISIFARDPHRHPNSLQSDLYHEIQKPFGIDKDWRRFSITIGNEASDNAFLSSLSPGTFAIGRSFPNACEWCRNSIDGKPMMVIAKSPPDYSKVDPRSQQYKEIAELWDHCLWIGKTNRGRARTEHKLTPDGLRLRFHHERSCFTTLCHPNGRCYPEEIDPDEMFIDHRGRMQVKYLDEDGWRIWLNQVFLVTDWHRIEQIAYRYSLL